MNTPLPGLLDQLPDGMGICSVVVYLGMFFGLCFWWGLCWRAGSAAWDWIARKLKARGKRGVIDAQP